MAAREIGDHLVLFYPRSKELVVAGRVLIFHKVGLVCLYRALVGVQMDLLELRGARGEAAHSNRKFLPLSIVTSEVTGEPVLFT